MLEHSCSAILIRMFARNERFCEHVHYSNGQPNRN